MNHRDVALRNTILLEFIEMLPRSFQNLVRPDLSIQCPVTGRWDKLVSSYDKGSSHKDDAGGQESSKSGDLRSAKLTIQDQSKTQWIHGTWK